MPTALRLNLPAHSQQAGLQPTSLELVAVEHVVTRSIPLWRDLVDGLTSLLRLPGSAGSRAASAAETEADLLGALMTADAGEADEVQGQAQWDTLAAARAGEAGEHKNARLVDMRWPLHACMLSVARCSACACSCTSQCTELPPPALALSCPPRSPGGEGGRADAARQRL